MVTAVACESHCQWTAKAQAWIDENGDGLWDTGELPLANVAFYVDETLHRHRNIAQNAVSDSNGRADVIVWVPQYTCGGFVVYAEAPANYEATTPERVADAGQELFQFGYRYRAGLPTPTNAPAASPIPPVGIPATPTSSHTPLPFDWPVTPLTPEQVLAVMQCDLENLPAQRYSESVAGPDLLAAHRPQTDCDWAALAIAYAGRNGEDESLSEAAQHAYTQAVAGNPGFALADPLF
jgi:hypothetical protein